MASSKILCWEFHGHLTNFLGITAFCLCYASFPNNFGVSKIRQAVAWCDAGSFCIFVRTWNLNLSLSLSFFLSACGRQGGWGLGRGACTRGGRRHVPRLAPPLPQPPLPFPAAGFFSPFFSSLGGGGGWGVAAKPVSATGGLIEKAPVVACSSSSSSSSSS